MAFELIYTSTPSGLTRGSSGFCVVACTQGIGPRLMLTLEGLSAYKPIYPHFAPNAWDNPIARSHYLYTANGETQHILSRICFNGVDHTQRSNKLASHLVLNKSETFSAEGGPSSLLLHEELFKDSSWEIKAEFFSTQKTIPPTSVLYKKCTAWENVMGDAGWAGYLAQTFVDTPNKNVYISYQPEQNHLILPLLHEAISLLPKDLRWQITFNTYFVSLPAGMNCTWRCCLADSDPLRLALRSPNNIIIDLNKPQILSKNSDLIELARTGIKKQSIKIPNSTEPQIPKQNTIPEKPINTPQQQPIPPQIKLPVKNTSKIYQKTLYVNNNPPQTNNPNPHKAIFIIAMITMMSIAAIIGVFYGVSTIKQQKLYEEKNIKLQDLHEEFKNIHAEIVNIESTERSKDNIDGYCPEFCENVR